jgi:hypothetical protein
VAAKENDLILLAMELRASKQQMVQTIDALLARVESLLPPDNHLRHAAKFRRYTRADWDRFVEGGKE